MKNHKWENDKCIRCGLERFKKSFSWPMAMVGSKIHYKHERVFVYRIEGINTKCRPACNQSGKL
jgi:hypothetical protein